MHRQQKAAWNEPRATVTFLSMIHSLSEPNHWRRNQKPRYRSTWSSTVGAWQSKVLSRLNPGTMKHSIYSTMLCWSLMRSPKIPLASDLEKRKKYILLLLLSSSSNIEWHRPLATASELQLFMSLIFFKDRQIWIRRPFGLTLLSKPHKSMLQQCTLIHFFFSVANILRY